MRLRRVATFFVAIALICALVSVSGFAVTNEAAPESPVLLPYYSWLDGYNGGENFISGFDLRYTQHSDLLELEAGYFVRVSARLRIEGGDWYSFSGGAFTSAQAVVPSSAGLFALFTMTPGGNIGGTLQATISDGLIYVGSGYYALDTENYLFEAQLRYEYRDPEGVISYGTWSQTAKYGANAQEISPSSLPEAVAVLSPSVQDGVVTFSARLPEHAEQADSMPGGQMRYLIEGAFDGGSFAYLAFGELSELNEQVSVPVEQAEHTKLRIRLEWYDGQAPDNYGAISPSLTSPWATVIEYGTLPWSDISDWMISGGWSELAVSLAVTPDTMLGSDWTQNATRLQCASVALELYERLGGQLPSGSENPFSDTAHPDAVNAAALSITVGAGYDANGGLLFLPNAELTRQEAATMLVRAFKAATMPEWTIENDALFPLSWQHPLFADDGLIEHWYRESIYYLSYLSVLDGVGDNRCDPLGNVTGEQLIKLLIGSILEL